MRALVSSHAQTLHGPAGNRGPLLPHPCSLTSRAVIRQVPPGVFTNRTCVIYAFHLHATRGRHQRYDIIF
jgi:hypothetical protein